MKKWMILCCVCAALVQAGSGLSNRTQAQDSAERTLKANQVARVGERIITAEEFIQRLTEREKTYNDPDLRTSTAALDSLVVDSMLELEADRLEGWPKAREITDETNAIRKAWDADFAALNEQIKAKQKESGLEIKPWTKAEFLEKRYNMTVAQFDAWQGAVAKRNLMRRLMVNYWLLSTKSAKANGIHARTKTDIDKIAQRLKNGEKFSIVARDTSEDMHTRERMGEIGLARPNDGSLEAELEEPFWKLEVGNISAPIKTTRGYWILMKSEEFVATEAPFFDQRSTCIAMDNVDDIVANRWRHAIAASGRYAYERRMPGLDCQAGEE